MQVADWDAAEEHWANVFSRSSINSKESGVLLADSPTVWHITTFTVVHHSGADQVSPLDTGQGSRKDGRDSFREI